MSSSILGQRRQVHSLFFVTWLCYVDFSTSVRLLLLGIPILTLFTIVLIPLPYVSPPIDYIYYYTLRFSIGSMDTCINALLASGLNSQR